MPYIKPEAVTEARRIDLLSYLRASSPDELIHCGNGAYKLKSHDSLKISNGKWYWWSRGIGGVSALDYLVKVEGLSFVEAVEALTGKPAIGAPVTRKAEPEKEVKALHLPEKSPSTARVKTYLSAREIDDEIIAECIAKGIIYESLPYHNVVFVGVDEHGTPRYAAWRAASTARMMGDCAGSDKRFSFRLVSTESADVHFFESAIDALSYATLMKQSGRDWRKLSLVSLGGVASGEAAKLPLAAEEYLKGHSDVSKIYLHLDNDEAGRTATSAIKSALAGRAVLDVPAPSGKDYNDFLREKNRSERNDYER